MDDPTDILGRRIGAGFVDLLVVFVLLIVVGIAFGEDESSGGTVSVTLEGVSALVWALASLAYYGVPEALTGQTLGKRVMGIRVVRVEDGGPAGPGRVALRTLLRVVDGFAFYLVGVIVIALSGKRRGRLGDLAGRTAVARA